MFLLKKSLNFAYYTIWRNGRLEYKTMPEGTYNYTYGTNKKISGVTSPDGVSRSYSYDNDGFLTEISETIETGETSTVIISPKGDMQIASSIRYLLNIPILSYKTNNVNFVYDNYGRVSTKTYTNADNNSYTITNVYNTYGYLDQVKFDNTIVWDLTNMNERGQITQASLQGTPCTWSYGTDGILDEVDAGSVHNYEYDFDVYTGNLDYRKNALENLQEDFTYDNLDRLDEVYGPIDYQVMYYENNGNIDVKSDAGDFEYNYPTRPFQISDIDGYQDIVDTTRQDIDYTSFSKIETITQGAYEATFKYNSDNQRVKMVLENNGSVSKTKYYFGSCYEKVVEGSTTTEYIWIGGSPYDAVAVAEITNGGTPEIYSIYRDHLGTMTHIKSSSTTNKYSFDACSVKLSFCELCETKALVELIPISEAVREGRRRDADTWNYTLTGEPGLFADRGFTGHEHMPEFGLINMNGRVYDPVLGRFLSPDNYVQDFGFSQNFNRYSYCLNNPLVYTDPDGEIILTLCAALIPGGQAFLPAAIMADFGGIMNIVNNWKTVRKAYDKNFWSGFGKMFGYYGVGASQGIATYYGGAFGTVASEYAGDALNSLLYNGTIKDYNPVETTQNLAVNLAVKKIGLGDAVGDKVGDLMYNAFGKEVVKNITSRVISNNVDGFISDIGRNTWEKRSLKKGFNISWDHYTKGYGWAKYSASGMLDGLMDTYDFRTRNRNEMKETMEAYYQKHNSFDGFGFESFLGYDGFYNFQLRYSLGMDYRSRRFVKNSPKYFWGDDIWWPSY